MHMALQSRSNRQATKPSNEASKSDGKKPLTKSSSVGLVRKPRLPVLLESSSESSHDTAGSSSKEMETSLLDHSRSMSHLYVNEVPWLK